MSKKSEDGLQELLNSVVSSVVAHDELESTIIRQFMNLMEKSEDDGGLSTFEKIKVLEILKKEKSKNIGAVLGYLKQNTDIKIFLNGAGGGNIAQGAAEKDVTPVATGLLDIKQSANVLNFLRKASAIAQLSDGQHADV